MSQKPSSTDGMFLWNVSIPFPGSENSSFIEVTVVLSHPLADTELGSKKGFNPKQELKEIIFFLFNVLSQTKYTLLFLFNYIWL